MKRRPLISVVLGAGVLAWVDERQPLASRLPDLTQYVILESHDRRLHKVGQPLRFLGMTVGVVQHPCRKICERFGSSRDLSSPY